MSKISTFDFVTFALFEIFLFDYQYWTTSLISYSVADASQKKLFDATQTLASYNY